MRTISDLPRPFFVLAPMDDVTDTVFRQIVGECAAPDMFFTEFVNVDGLQSAGRERLINKLRYTEIERPIVAQIWGKNPDNYYKTAKEIVAMGFDGVDINMGCPDKAVVKSGCCAALINNKDLAMEIIQAVREGAGSHFPVSVKTRVGFKEVDLTWTEHLLNSKQKLNMLTIHGRTAAQLSKVPANWELIDEVRKQRDSLSPSTLIVGNGDVKNRKQGLDLATSHQLDGIMIGRGVFEDPFSFSENSPWNQYSAQQRIKLYIKHVDLFAKTWQKNERKIYTLNKFCKIYINGFDGAKELRAKLMTTNTTEELLNLLYARG